MSGFDTELFTTPALKQRLEAEAEFQKSPTWCVFVASAQTHCYENGYQADPGERLVAQQMLHELNAHLHHDGSWVWMWLHQGRFAVALWMDEDGDPQFSVEFDEDAAGLVEVDLRVWVQQCEQAWQHWKKMMRDVLDPQEGETYKRAKGEKKPSLGTGPKAPPIGDIILH